MPTKPDQYYSHAREDVDSLLPVLQGAAVLELGCGEGATGARMKRMHGARRVDGVELDPTAGARAREELDDVEIGSLEGYSPTREYDLVLALDVLEHLADPGPALTRVVANGLKLGGCLITSMPNIRYWRILYDLAVQGKWQYGPEGILDTTHVRFFTRSSIEELHRAVGCVPDAVLWPDISGKRRILDTLTGGRLREFLSGQCVVRSRRIR